MKKQNLVMFALLALTLLTIVLASGSPAGAARQADNFAAASASAAEAPALNNTHLVMYGTAWVPERRSQVKYTYAGWGTIFQKKKAISGEWIHIPIPIASYNKGVAQKISSVQFCAKISSANSRPTQVDLWDVDNRFYVGAITGWPVNTIHCHTVGFNPPVWRSALGMSVHLNFANLTDTITMYKAWVNLTE